MQKSFIWIGIGSWDTGFGVSYLFILPFSVLCTAEHRHNQTWTSNDYIIHDEYQHIALNTLFFIQAMNRKKQIGEQMHLYETEKAKQYN